MVTIVLQPAEPWARQWTPGNRVPGAHVSERRHRLPSILLAMVALAGVVAVIATGRLLGGGSTQTGPGMTPTVAPVTSGTTASRPGTTAEQTGPRQWFVSSSGSNSGAGSRQSPLATAEHAASLARPGDSIVLMAGAHDEIVLDGVNGTAAQPIRVIAESGASVSSGSINSLAAFLVKNSSHLEIHDVRVHTALWGFLVEYSNDIDLIDVVSEDVGQEGIKISYYSHHVLVDGATVRRTGLKTDLPYTGEGIYLGSGRNDIQDSVNNVVIRNSEISFTTAEAIDIKAYVHDVVVEGNFIHDIDTFNSGAVVVGIGTRVYPDPAVVIRNNTITRVRATESPYADANCIALSAAATVYNNVLYDCADRGIYVLRDFPNPAARTVNIWFNTVVSNGRFGDIVDEGVAATNLVNNIGSAAPGNVATDTSFFVDPAGLNFRLLPSAGAAIDQGTSISGVRSDSVGAARQSGPAPDYGALELPAQRQSSTSTTTTTPTSTSAPSTVAPPTAPTTAEEPASSPTTAATTTTSTSSARSADVTIRASSAPPAEGGATSDVRSEAPAQTITDESVDAAEPGEPTSTTTPLDGESTSRSADPGSQLVESDAETSTTTVGPQSDGQRPDTADSRPNEAAAQSFDEGAGAAGEGADLDEVPDQLALVDATWSRPAKERRYSLVGVGFAALALVSVGVRVHSHRRRGAADL